MRDEGNVPVVEPIQSFPSYQPVAAHNTGKERDVEVDQQALSNLPDGDVNLTALDPEIGRQDRDGIAMIYWRLFQAVTAWLYRRLS